MSYLKGSAGLLLVVDCTRREALDTALDLLKRSSSEHASMTYIFLLNKSDLVSDRDVEEEKIAFTYFFTYSPPWQSYCGPVTHLKT
jgi:signal recognition particle receptor subunit beta